MNHGRRYWLRWDDVSGWRIVWAWCCDGHEVKFGVGKAAFTPVLYIELLHDDPRHFQIGARISPRAIVGV
jgi:hypothetical protein